MSTPFAFAGGGGVTTYNAVLAPPSAWVAQFVEGRADYDLRAYGDRLLLDVDLSALPLENPLVHVNQQAFGIPLGAGSDAPVDPRWPAPVTGEARVMPGPGSEPLLDRVVERLDEAARAGASGALLRALDRFSADFWTALIGRLRANRPEMVFIAATTGLERRSLVLQGCGFDYVTFSVSRWAWPPEEYEALRRIAPVLMDIPAGGDVVRGMRLAAAFCSGWIAPADSIEPSEKLLASLMLFDGEVRALTGPGEFITVLLRGTTGDLRASEAGLLVLINPDQEKQAEIPISLLGSLGRAFGPYTRLEGKGESFMPLAPGEVRLLTGPRARPILLGPKGGKAQAKAAAEVDRIAIEALSPSVDGGRFAVKRTVGDPVVVEADIFADGHEQLAAEVLWRPADGKDWRAVRMVALGNDRWRAEFIPERMGRHLFVVEAWLDVFGGYRRDLGKKLQAGVAAPVDLLEGRLLVQAAHGRSSGALREALGKALDGLEAIEAATAPDLLLSPELAALMDKADPRPYRTTCEPQALDAERLGARFASWYELFPRSITDSPGPNGELRHGTFDDVISRLPAVRAMGFDVLYFPPIHPIGTKNRKGRNNSLTPGPDDPGSPYAIGSADGGHDAVHPELGGIEGFDRLVAAARENGLEVALDFAVQCSPDHPWLKEHPGWFDWRPDGSIKYAENPPKKYEDIVNVDFYKLDAIPGLWLALRDAVLFWVEHGVRLFRVDNPHTKPLPFWEWMIADVRARYPDAVFLAEAFTRPKVMYRLAKIGFSQSYTYFTWRHSKQEFIDYLTELTTTAPKDFFRPHFFVNTPDINPYFLQSSGRAGFLIRAALAATLSGLFGVYSGFELLEADPVPGKEEYKDSEKYEIRPRDYTRPGNIIAEITRLNQVRKAHPALQTHLGVRFYNAFNDQVLYYGKATPSMEDMVLVAVNLDPHNAQGFDFEVPLWEWGIPDDGTVEVEDMLHGHRFAWHGKVQRHVLTPDQPYAIWRIQPPRQA